MMLIPCRRLTRLLICVLVISFISTLLLWISDDSSRLPVTGKSERDDWISLRLSRDQKEYIDGRGVHVVVGHYMGDPSSPGHPPNLTDEMINSNMFDPKPLEGRNGQPVIIQPHQLGKMQQLFHINRFNLMASDKIPLNRSLPDVRKKRCQMKYKETTFLPTTTVVIVFHNEAWSTLLRTVHSVINRSPRNLLKEIILVDDASTRKFLGKALDDYVASLPVNTYVLRTVERMGLIKARMVGARKAEGQVLTFLDAHCECTQGWLESLLFVVAQDRTRVACPVIDIISDDSFAYVRSFELHWGAFNWEMHFRWFTLGGEEIRKRNKDPVEPFRTPAMAGGLFAMNKDYFFELGGYDEDMEIWGGENLELSFRVWQCGGSVEIVPCSHVGHLFRKSSPYTFPGGVGEILFSNLARVALVWMDEWKEFYFKFNPDAERVRDKVSVRSRLELREQLKCKSFKWYLDNVWPQHFFPMEDRFFGRIRNRQTGHCLVKPSEKGSFNQPMGSAMTASCASDPVLYQMFVITPNGAVMTDESICLDAPEKEYSVRRPKVRIMACSGLKRQKWKYNKKTETIEHLNTSMCLDLPELSNNSEDEGLVINKCSTELSQKWILEEIPWK